MQEQLRNVRLELDRIAALTGRLDPSRESALAKTHFQESKMMLGKVLGELGEANPYPESKNPTSPVIEKTAERSGPVEWSSDTDHITRVKTLRQDSDATCNELKSLMNFNHENKISLEVTIFLEQAFIEANKGMMWLGMELGRIRDTADGAQS